MALYLTSNCLVKAVEQLRCVDCNSAFIDYLLILAANVDQGATGTVIISGKKLEPDTKKAKFVYGTEADDSAPYFNPFNGEYLSSRHWSNGPSDTVSRWGTRDHSPCKTIPGAATKTIRINDFNSADIRTFFNIKEATTPSLASLALWWFRYSDVSGMADDSNHLNLIKLEDEFLNQIGLTREQASELFDNRDTECFDGALLAETPAAPSDYMPPNSKLSAGKPANSIPEPHALIFSGAPGTGKSHQLKQLADQYFDDKVTRVTFYPDYTYSQFVGCYKPCTNDEGNVTYGYVAGPFLDTYLKASTHLDKRYVLIIEEINRANPAAVFGDVFQLLDRGDFGWSEYPLAVPNDMRSCIKVYLSHLSEEEKQAIEAYRDPYMDFSEFRTDMLNHLSLPPNMYIWATMNSADQGVFPIDTAFRRRWEPRHIGINDCEDAMVTIRKGEEEKRLNEIVVSWGKDGAHRANWNNLRRAINGFLSDAAQVNEDKLLGPFFMNPTSLTNERFGDAFKYKVLLYLYEDACKTKRSKVFASDLKTYSDVCSAFDERGLNIFADGFKNHYQEEASATSQDDASTEE